MSTTNTVTNARAEAEAEVEAEVVAGEDDWMLYTNFRDCGAAHPHPVHVWGPLAEREWCKGEPKGITQATSR